MWAFYWDWFGAPPPLDEAARRMRLRRDVLRIARRVTEEAYQSSYDMMPIIVKASGGRDAPTDDELESMTGNANAILNLSLVRVRSLYTQPHKYVGGDFGNSHDGDLGTYVLTGFATFGLGFFAWPYLYHKLGRMYPSRYYRVYYDVSLDRKQRN